MSIFFIIMLVAAAIGLVCVGFRQTKCTKISDSTLNIIIKVTLIVEYVAFILHFVFK